MSKDDIAPIIAPHLEEQKKIPEFVSRPALKTMPSPPDNFEDRVKQAIKSAISVETRPEWRQLIKDTECFVRLWKDPDSNDYCDLYSCDLRQMCHYTWEREFGGLEAGEKPATASEWGAKKKPEKRKKKRRRKWENTDKYVRAPYVDLGRPIDKIVSELYDFLGKPEVLAKRRGERHWVYPTAKAKKRGKPVHEVFIKKWGNLCVAKTISYHTYFYQGRHLFRIWVDTYGSARVDIPKLMKEKLLSVGQSNIMDCPLVGKQKNKNKYFPFRTIIFTEKDLRLFKEALQEIEGLVSE